MARSTKKLNMAAMKKAATTLNLKLPKGDPKAAAQALREYFTSNHEADALAACGNCGWEATDDFAKCPYCGMTLGEATDGPEPFGDGAVDVEKPKTKKSPAKRIKKDKKDKVRKKIKSKQLAKQDPKKIAECDEHVEKIKGFRRNLAEEAYNIGIELKAIHDGNLWKHKGFKSFSAFCKVVLDYTRVMAYKYMSMASVNQADAVQLGVSKVDLIVNAPPKRQRKLLEMGKEGKSRKEMEDWLRNAEGKAPGGASRDDSKITLLGRASMGDTFVNWLGDKSGKPTSRDTQGKHAEFIDIVTGFSLYIREDEGGKGLICTLKKNEEPEAAPEAAKDEETKADTNSEEKTA